MLSYSKNSDKKLHLLEFFQLKSGCEYMSDLHLPRNLPLIQRALREISAKDYEIEEWEDAINYITQDKVKFSDSKQAFHYLINYQSVKSSIKYFRDKGG